MRNIPPPDHLIKKEVELVRQHFTDNRMISLQPGINLLSNRCIEEPFCEVIEELRKLNRVAILLTILVRCLVLVQEMPDIDTHSDTFKPGKALLCLLTCKAIGVVEYVLRLFHTRHRKSILDHHLLKVLTMGDYRLIRTGDIQENWILLPLQTL
jgi:hypothetical protein